ncbi:MAG: hypothetical protein RAO94_10250 [Candidatus Stygibacter australis]|nr:hypothetical protein [Candidatus Stygibacter australis]MDP8322719.1 hypothetical protein [Candidatus Stygibacter australis]
MDYNQFPLPIFTAHKEYASSRTGTEKFRSGMRLFTSVLKYCSIVAIADYLQYLEAGGEPELQLTNLLYTNLFRPSLGHWNHFLRDSLVFRRKRELEEDSGLFYDLDGAYFKKRHKTSPGKLAVIFNELISIRNEWFHPGLDPDENNAPGLLTKIETKIEEMLEHLKFLEHYPLFHYLGEEKHELMGDVSFGWTESEVAKLNSGERQLFIETGNEKPTPLNFLIELQSNSSGDELQFMLFETARINKQKSVRLIKFILGNQWGFDERLYLDLANEAQKLLRIEQKEDIVEVAELNWNYINSISKGLMKANRQNLEDSGKVIPLLYVNRSKIEGEAGFFEQFLQSKKTRCLVLLGDSGHGKTNTLWKLSTHRLLREKKGYLAKFFYEARNIDPMGLKQELDQNFDLVNTLSSLVQMMKDKSPKLAEKEVIIFIDAINEFTNPALLMREILDCYPAESLIDLRFVVSCRTISWSRILVTLSNQQEELVFSYLEESEKRYPTLAEYSEDELKAAYDNYCDKFHIETKLEQISPGSMNLIKDPLMLRMAAEAYCGTESEKGIIPRQLDISTIFKNYDTKAQIDVLRDEPFLANLIECMWDHHHSMLSGNVIRSHNELQEIVYSTPVNLPPGSTYQCSNCSSIFKIGDQGFEADDPCPDCDSMSMKPVPNDWRTTYERLLDEGIITEDFQADDIAIRFVYDRYYEYRTSCWILKKFAPLDIDVIRKLVIFAHQGETPILLEAIKLAVRMCENWESIILKLAESEDQGLMDMAESIILGMNQSAEEGKVSQLIQKLIEGSVPERVIAINAAVEITETADAALLKEIPQKEGNEVISQALSRALYLIWRNDPARAVDLMEKLRQQISLGNFIKQQFSLFSVLLEVTFKTLGVLHHKEEIVTALGDFWIKLITQNLRLGKKGIFNELLSKSVKLALVNAIQLFGNRLFKKHGVSFGKGDNAFREDEILAILTLLDAWNPGSEAINEVTEIMLKYGHNTLNENQQNRMCSTIAAYFGIPACVAAINHDPQATIAIYDNTFMESRNLHDKGRATRFFTYSGVNFALQLNYPKFDDPQLLTPVYEKLYSWYLILLEEDPEIFSKAEIIEGIPNSSFGIFSQATVRMGQDLINNLVKPMLTKAQEGHSGLLKSYLRTSLFSLDTFSQRVFAHLSALKSYDYLLSIPDLAAQTGMEEREMMRLFVEAYAVISVGYPSDVELFVVNNKNIPAGFLELVRQARNKPSILFDQQDQQTLEQYINNTLQSWTISDGGNSVLANFPALRKIIDKYFRDAVACGDLAKVLSKAVKDLFDFLISQGKKIN